MDFKLKLKACIQVADALRYLHTPQFNTVVHHRDLKSENVLVFKLSPPSVHVKLCDFGISRRHKIQNGAPKKLD